MKMKTKCDDCGCPIAEMTSINHVRTNWLRPYTYVSVCNNCVKARDNFLQETFHLVTEARERGEEI